MITKCNNIDVGNQEPYIIFNLSLEIRILRKKSWKTIIFKIGFSLHSNKEKIWFKIYLFLWTFVISD